MLRISGRPLKTCNGMSRRQVLQVGGAGLFGVGAESLAAADAAGLLQSAARARSVMFLYLFGGPSQLETFDMKPESPSTVRGPFSAIAARTPGLRICEHLPRLAACSDRYAVIRTLNHTQNDHNAAHIIQTGWPMPVAERGPANVNAAPNDWPAMGSVVAYLDRHRAASRQVPSYIYLPNRHGEIQLGGRYNRLGQYAGWLGPEYNALSTRIRKKAHLDNPYFRDCTEQELQFQFRGLSLGEGVTLDRLDRRRSLLEQFEEQRVGLEESGNTSIYDRHRQSALGMVSSTKLREALDIRRESPSLRDRYGRHLFGQSLMVGRRMVEAGSRFVTVVWDMPDGAPSGWDSHEGMTASLRDHLLPGLDQAVSALLADMHDRGLLDETLVVCVGEMGRTPKFENRGSADGRDHWGYCFPALLAGAGVSGGVLYGQSDRIAGHPLDHPVSPADLSATIFDSLGVDPHSTIRDKEGRPVPLVDGGEVVRGLYA
ncbi:MAG: hypothetical protein CMJ68_15670 [Planctomycetaceae bacterium]|nr:hypothetical protein [Planctomycetaceae bacterium]